ncbi:hypothetical protein DM01DRAFT_1333920 [Hesseltinella vesiculosa]|uniref:Ubiquitin-like domain-containing protein n=1 Tax=Hesseltinella vesiculosa TaxID=101127 RepID=A0A1X2GPJ2_9FUNG|nr:hypothetical protein DM01DRAFT_1333920 [Hesseltinella vesiculosa]
MGLDPTPTTDQVVMYCGETLLSPTMTLASIRQHIMKSNGDIVLSYKMKTPTSCPAP